MPGAPQVGQFFGVDPFRFNAPQAPQRRQVQPEVPANYGTGFSPDGLSYSVIDDFDKLASQALAEYEARVKNPRYDIWGEVLQEDRPEVLKQTLLDPIQQIIGGGQDIQRSPLRTYKTAGGGVVGINPESGETNMLVPDAPPKDLGPSYAEKQRIASLYRDRNAILGNMLKTPEDKTRLSEIETEIKKLETPVAPAATAQKVTAPPMWASWPQQGNIVGTQATNSFSGTTAPFTQPQQKRVLKFNRATGRLE